MRRGVKTKSGGIKRASTVRIVMKKESKKATHGKVFTCSIYSRIERHKGGDKKRTSSRDGVRWCVNMGEERDDHNMIRGGISA